MQGTVLSFIGRSKSHSCGYCKSANKSLKTNDSNGSGEPPTNSDDENNGSSISFGVTAYWIGIDIFNRFLDMGWSRSGKYLYKPIMEETCCPQYTIRLDVHKFQLSRTQKRVLRTMLEFLRHDRRPAATKSSSPNEASRLPCKKRAKSGDSSATPITSKASEEVRDHSRKKKFIRRLRAEERLRRNGVNLEEYRKQRMEREMARRRTLESFFEPSNAGEWKHKFEVRLVNVLSSDFKNTFRESYDLFKKYQIFIHDDDDVSEDTYHRFLESSPFTFTDGSQANQLGAFHEQFLLDGNIIAVGVVDILPECVSSKYFFYDPDYKFLSMGTYSALREIYMTKTLAQRRPELHFYYMGFYVYTCSKMRYKGKFRPSDLLCEKTHEWFPLSECDKMLAANNGMFTTFCDGKRGADVLTLSAEEIAQNDLLAEGIICTVDAECTMRFADLKKHYFVTHKVKEDLRLLAYYGGSLVEKILLLYSLSD